MTEKDETHAVGEVVDASVSGGINVKLSLTSPENIKTGYPVIAEGEKYDFYCIVMDVFNPPLDVVDTLATSDLGKRAIPAVSPGNAERILWQHILFQGITRTHPTDRQERRNTH